MFSNSYRGNVSCELAPGLNVGMGSDFDTATQSSQNRNVAVHVDGLAELYRPSAFVLKDQNPISDKDLLTALEFRMMNGCCRGHISSGSDPSQMRASKKRRYKEHGEAGGEPPKDTHSGELHPASNPNIGQKLTHTVEVMGRKGQNTLAALRSPGDLKARPRSFQGGNQRSGPGQLNHLKLDEISGGARAESLTYTAHARCRGQGSRPMPSV